MARTKRRRSSRRRGNFIKKVSRRRRSRNRLGTSQARLGFLSIPARPIDLILGGAGSIAAGIGVPWLLSKIPVAALQSGWGNVAASAGIGVVLGGIVGKFNKPVGLGIAIGAIASAGVRAIALAQGGGVAGFASGGTPLIADNWMAGGYGAGLDVSGYGSGEQVSGYGSAEVFG